MPLTFGYCVQPTPRPNMRPADLMDYNRAAIEALSPAFTTVWIEDHIQWEDRPTLEAWTTLTYLAALYPRFDYGTIVLGQSYRNPALLAKMGATLHYLTGGRFIMGIGAGWKEDEYRAYGYPYPAPGARIAQLAETIEIMRALWTESPATYHGKHYSIESAYCAPRPQPMIPIHVGGSGEKGTLRVAARLADAWNFGFGTVATLDHKLAVLKEHCAVVGRDFSTLRLTYYGVTTLPEEPTTYAPKPDDPILGPTPADAVAKLRAFAERGVSHVILRVTDLATIDRFVAEVAPAFA